MRLHAEKQQPRLRRKRGIFRRTAAQARRDGLRVLPRAAADGDLPRADALAGALRQRAAHISDSDKSDHRSPSYRICPFPRTMYFQLVSSCKPIGPRAWSFCVEMPSSQPRPNSPPSVKRVDALT